MDTAALNFHSEQKLRMAGIVEAADLAVRVDKATGR